MEEIIKFKYKNNVNENLIVQVHDPLTRADILAAVGTEENKVKHLRLMEAFILSVDSSFNIFPRSDDINKTDLLVKSNVNAQDIKLCIDDIEYQIYP